MPSMSQKAARPSSCFAGSSLFKFGIKLLAFTQLTEGQRVIDLCSGYQFPQAYGINDGNVIGFCFAEDTFGGGYWISGWTDSATLQGTANSGAFAVYLDTNYETQNKLMFNDDSGVGFDVAASCETDDTSSEIAFITLDPMTIIFYTLATTPKAYLIQSGGTTLANYDPGNEGYNQAIIFKSGTLYFGINANDGSDKPRLISMQPDGTVNWSIKYDDLTSTTIDVFTSLFLDTGVLYTISVQESNGATINVISKVNASTGNVDWLYGEFYGVGGYYIVYMFQDFATDAYLLCNNSYSDHELEYVFYTLDGAGIPSNHHYFVYYEWISGLYAGIRCAGAYIAADGDSGVVVLNKYYPGSFSKQCVVYQDSLRSSDVADFNEVCLENSSLGSGEVSFTNPAWWVPADNSFNVLYWDVEVGHILYSTYATIISSIDITQLCNSFYHTQASQTYSTSYTGSFASSLALYYPAQDWGYITSSNTVLTAVSTSVSIVDILADVQEAIQPCEILEIDTDPVDVYYYEQILQTHQHSAFTVYLDTCFGSLTITHSSSPAVGPFESWMTYDGPTRTYTMTDLSVQGTYPLVFTATTEGSLFDEENAFNLILLPLNLAPTIVSDVIDVEVTVGSVGSQTISIADLDPTDSHYLVCTLDPLLPVTVTVDCTSGTTITYTPTDNVLDIGVYFIDIVIWDDDSDATGFPLSVTSVGFWLTILEQVSDSPQWQGTFKQKVYVDLTEKLEWRPPAFGAPDITETPFENVTILGTDNAPPNFIKIKRNPLLLIIDPKKEEQVKDYDLNITITFYNYGDSLLTYRLEGVLTVIVTNYAHCFEKGYFDDQTLRLGEVYDNHIQKWDDVVFEKPCIYLDFIFKHDYEHNVGQGDTDFMTPEYARWLNLAPTEERHTGVWEITVFAHDYIIAEREIARFTVTVVSYITQTEINEFFQLDEDERPLDVRVYEVTPEAVAKLKFTKKLQKLSDPSVLKEPYPAFDFFINPNEGAYEKYLDEAVKKGIRRGKVEDSDGDERRLNMNQFHETSVPDTTGDSDMLNYVKDYKVLKQSGNKIFFQLYFDERYVISQEPIWDLLHVDILDTRNLVSKDGEQLKMKDMENKAPPFVDIGDWKLLDTMGSILYAFILITIFVLLPISLFIGGSTQALWIFLSAVQLTVHLPQLGTYFPNNIERMLMKIVDITNLKFVVFNPFMTIFKDYFEINYQGYSNNVIWSLNTLLLITLIPMMITFIGYQSYQRFFYGIRGPRNFCLKLASLFTFNFFIRLGIQGYLVYSIASYMNIADLKFDTMQNIYGAILAIILGPLVFMAPIALTHKLHSYRYDLPYTRMMNICESAYNEVRTHRTSALLYNVIQMSRRSILAIVIVGFRNMQSIQFQPLAFTSMLCCYYSFHYKPFIYNQLNWFDLFNEITITVLSYMVAAFTDYVDDQDVRYEFGKAWIVIFMLNFYIDFIYVTFRTLSLLLLKLRRKLPKKYWARYRYIKQKGVKTKLKIPLAEMDQTARSLLGSDGQKAKIGIQKDDDQLATNPDKVIGLQKQKTKRKVKKGVDSDGLVDIQKKKKSVFDRRKSKAVGLGNTPSLSMSTHNSLASSNKRMSISPGKQMKLGMVQKIRRRKTEFEPKPLMKVQPNNFLEVPEKKPDSPNSQGSAAPIRQTSPLSAGLTDDQKARKQMLGNANSQQPLDMPTESPMKKKGPAPNYRNRMSGFFDKKITNELTKGKK